MKNYPLYGIANGELYLNNRGDRWIQIENYRKVKVWIKHNGVTMLRTALYFESFGNFVSVTVSLKGKKISTLSYCREERTDYLPYLDEIKLPDNVNS